MSADGTSCGTLFHKIATEKTNKRQKSYTSELWYRHRYPVRNSNAMARKPTYIPFCTNFSYRMEGR